MPDLCWVTCLDLQLYQIWLFDVKDETGNAKIDWVHHMHISCSRNPIIEIIWDLRTINNLGKFEKYLRKVVGVTALKGCCVTTTCHIAHLFPCTKLIQIARFMGPTWGPPGACRPQMGPMMAPWTFKLPGLRQHHCVPLYLPQIWVVRQ